MNDSKSSDLGFVPVVTALVLVSIVGAGFLWFRSNAAKQRAILQREWAARQVELALANYEAASPSGAVTGAAVGLGAIDAGLGLVIERWSHRVRSDSLDR